jgi:hypothetical protein
LLVAQHTTYIRANKKLSDQKRNSNELWIADEAVLVVTSLAQKFLPRPLPVQSVAARVRFGSVLSNRITFIAGKIGLVESQEGCTALHARRLHINFRDRSQRDAL